MRHESNSQILPSVKRRKSPVIYCNSKYIFVKFKTFRKSIEKENRRNKDSFKIKLCVNNPEIIKENV